MTSTLVQRTQRAESRTDLTDLSPDDLLDLLGDEYTRKVLRAVTEQPRSSAAIADATSTSKPTAYRRLDRLEAAGLVTSRTVLDPNGHHHKEFESVLEEATLRLEDGELDLVLEATTPA